jgi:hypothetical protein
MKKNFLYVSAAALFVGSFALASAGSSERHAEVQALTDTHIVANQVRSARMMSPVDRQGTASFMGVVVGKVDFEGPGPVYVTVHNGQQTYTAPTDPTGNYTFFIAVEARDVSADAWIPGQAPAITRASFR